MRQIALLLLAAAIAGCAMPINQRNAYMHWQAGQSLEARGNWDEARKQYAQAVVNADLGHDEPENAAHYNYDYGRAQGVECEYARAEQYLLRAKDFKLKAGGSPYLVVLELAVLSEKQGKTDAAARYYSELIPMMEQQGLDDQFPVGAAMYRERYAALLEASGQAQQAQAQRAKAGAIRAAHPGAAPFGAETPYGTMCPKH